MAEEKTEARETNWRQLLPWTELFRTFQVALDLNKLLLAAAGIFVMAFGWWLLALVFGSFYKVDPPAYEQIAAEYGSLPPNEQWKAFKEDRDSWNVMHRSADLGRRNVIYRWEPADLATTPDEYEKINKAVIAWKAGKPEERENWAVLDPATLQEKLIQQGIPPAKAQADSLILGKEKPSGLLATWPWGEDRGANPFLLVTGQTTRPWMAGQFWDWFLTNQAPVLIEPLVKFLRPIIFFLSPGADSVSRFYFLTVLVWTLLTWSLFGGAITRIAAVQVARGEKIGLVEAVRFTLKRYVSYVTAPLFPLAFVGVLVLFMIVFGFFHMIPVVGDILVSGLFWPVMIIFGLLMAIALIGLVGWPLMAATISTEGTDSWEAVSRSYSYVFQKPWHFLWYTGVSLVYGAVVIFFVGFLGSFAIYLSKWGVSKTPWIERAGRDPSFLFVYAPTSFGWRTLLLDGARTEGGVPVVQDGAIDPTAYNAYVGKLAWWNKVGAGLVAFWVGLVFLLVLGFGYSFFWSAATIIYLLMRRSVDGADLDEVYLEDEDESPFSAGTPPAAAPAAPPKPGLTMVEAPSLRPAAPPAAPILPPTSTDALPPPTTPTELPPPTSPIVPESPTGALLEKPTPSETSPPEIK
jgi:hypothetical protein